MAASVISIKQPTEFKDSVENIQIRLLGEVEQWVSDVEDVNARVEKCAEKCDKKLVTFWAWVEDLEPED